MNQLMSGIKNKYILGNIILLDNRFLQYKQINMTKNYFLIVLLSWMTSQMGSLHAQALRLPSSTNHSCNAGRNIAFTEIEITWNAPGVKGREGKIWGTDVAYFGTSVLGFGSDVASPWRAGADECTTMSFNSDVQINGQKLPAGKYAFFIELYEDSSILIFNSNSQAWGSYFYDKSKDVLRVSSKQQKNLTISKERLEFNFDNQTENSVEIALEWEYWRIPFTVQVDLKKTILANIQSQMSGALGFDPPSLQAAANWCLNNDVNLNQALSWITSATDPNLGGVQNFSALSIRSGLLEKLGNKQEAENFMKQALENGTSIELHQYGRKLLGQKKIADAMMVFEMNFKKNNGVWPTHVGLMRGYSALGNLKKALEHGKIALTQAPDDLNKKSLEMAIKTLESGKAL